MGTWMTNVAVIWLVYHLTNSTLLLGVIAFMSQAPSFFLTPWTGYWVDRWDRYRLLVFTQSIAMFRSLALTMLAFFGEIGMWQLALLALIQGLLDAFDLPTRQALVPELIDRKENLGNAIALNSSLDSASRLIGPALAGLVISFAGTKVCFLLDSLSYVAVIAALLAMNLPSPPKASNIPYTWQALKAGITYVFGSPPIRGVLLLMALVSFMGTPYIALGPAFAKDFLAGGSEIFGLLITASGIGALIGALYLSSWQSIEGLEKLVCVCPALLGLALGVFSQSRTLSLSAITIALIGFLLILQTAASNTILQTILEDDKRGRVMGLFTIASVGMIPFGNLFAGGIAALIGIPMTLVLEGLFCALGSLFFAHRISALRNLITLSKGSLKS